MQWVRKAVKESEIMDSVSQFEFNLGLLVPAKHFREDNVHELQTYIQEQLEDTYGIDVTHVGGKGFVRYQKD